MSDFAFNLFYPIINTLMFFANFPLFIDLKKHYKSYIIFFLTIYTTTFVLLDNKNLIFIMMTLFTFIYFKIIRINIITSILTYIYVLLAILIGDSLCGLIMEEVLNLSYEFVRNDNTTYFCCSIIILIVSFISCLIIRKITSLYNLNLTKVLFNTFTKRIFFFTILLLVVLISIFRVVLMDYIDNNWIIIYIISATILLSILFLLYYMMNTTISMSINKDFIAKENKQLKEYTDMLETMSTDLRKFKHDYINILYTLGDYINEGDIEGLRKYYNEDLIPESRSIVKNDKHITLLKNIKITPLKALISSKLLAAQSKGIDINAEVLEEINKISIKTLDICRIVGIFLDNAAEAAILCSKKFIHFAMIKTEGNIIIIIMNSCPKDIPPVYELYKKNFSTKGTNRGIGLTSVKDLIDSSYKNILLNTSANNGVFKQELIIKNCNSD